MLLLRRILTEPLVHFLALGVGVFVLYSALDDTPPAPTADQIVLTPAIVARLAANFEAVWQRPPTPAEVDGLVEDHIREEVYVREALDLGLDRGDIVIRRRLRQKMEFLTESEAGTLQPSEAELEAHYGANVDRFAPQSEVAFRQVFLGEDPAEAEIEAARAALGDGVAPDQVGRRTLLPGEMPLSTRRAVDASFGRGMFETVTALPSGRWGGPVASGFGQHLVLPLEVVAPPPPPFEAVRERVLSDWRLQKADELADRQFERLRARYEVIRPDPAAAEPAP